MIWIDYVFVALLAVILLVGIVLLIKENEMNLFDFICAVVLLVVFILAMWKDFV